MLRSSCVPEPRSGGSRGLVLAGDCDQGVERLGVGDGQVGEDLAIHLHSGVLQAVDEAVVGQALRTGGGVDALNPQGTEITLPGPAVAVGVGGGVEDLLLRLALQTRTLPTVAGGQLQHLATLLLRIHRTLDACHGYSLLFGRSLPAHGCTGIRVGLSGLSGRRGAPWPA